MSAKLSRVLPWGGVLVLFLISLWLINSIFDQAVTIDHYEQQQTMLLKQRNTLVSVVNAMGLPISRSSLLKYLNNNPTHSYFVKGENSVVIDNLSFYFENDRLYHVDIQ